MALAAPLQLEDIHHRFGRQRVLTGVDLRVERGECVVLFGANGSGKSTLLCILATLLKVQQGAYRLGKLEAPAQGDRIRDSLIFLGHRTHLYGHLTPVENLRFFADLRGESPTLAQVRAAVEQVGLGRFMDRTTARFSAGMRKRAALARVLLLKPPLLLLDEPYSALDSDGVNWLNALLSDYLKEGGMVVMASHEPERVACLYHRPMYLHLGHLSGWRP
ncbi:MAG: heme ABC exporter ATP-binding protein CcmA [Magnetococcales bacterium]|nr:heme ABC exporter ATP-binding protein CcmA [Magnetococcales bacterium]